jgi:hypothetical protein
VLLSIRDTPTSAARRFLAARCEWPLRAQKLARLDARRQNSISLVNILLRFTFVAAASQLKIFLDHVPLNLQRATKNAAIRPCVLRQAQDEEERE